jgi:hypothetical protein
VEGACVVHGPRATGHEPRTRGEFIKLVLDIPDWLAKPFISILLLYRRLRYGYPFRRIPLTRGKFAIVDPQHYDRLNQYTWHVTKNGNTFYAKRNPRVGRKSRAPSIYMHRCIIEIPPGLLIDHINYNGLDNREANIRPATRTQNNRHSKRTANPGTSKFKGVSSYSREKRWVVKIHADGKTYKIGYFKDEIEAAKAYDQAARKYHGEFAALNFPP